MYPKSSCRCYRCTQKKDVFPKGVPTNRAVRGCKVSPYFECYDRHLVKTNVQVKDDEKIDITYINPKVYTEKYSDDFQAVDNCKKNMGSPQPQYASWDPRTWSATSNDYTTFDRPPLSSSIKLKNIYNDDLKGYGQNYKSYNDVTAGQIIYYTDKSREDAYYRPIFNEKVKVGTVIYQDPMGAIKPEYPREVPYTNPITDKSCNNGDYCLSFIKDTICIEKTIWLLLWPRLISSDGCRDGQNE